MKKIFNWLGDWYNLVRVMAGFFEISAIVAIGTVVYFIAKLVSRFVVS